MIENILDNSIKYYSFVGIEHVRSLLLKQTEPIELKDLGVGSKSIKSTTSTINILTKKVQSRPEKAQILFRMVSFFQKKKYSRNRHLFRTYNSLSIECQ
jgi:hypothetical protein